MTVFLRYKLRTFRVPEKPVSNPRHFHKLIKKDRKPKNNFRTSNSKNFGPRARHGELTASEVRSY